MRNTVSIIQEAILPYRLDFFSALKNSLAKNDIALKLYYGEARSAPDINAIIPWATPVDTYNFGPVYWQRVYEKCKYDDLVIVPQQVRHLSSLILQLTRRTNARKHAFWGHGKSLKATKRHAPTEAIKRFLSTRVDWWFAYNEKSYSIIENLGYPTDRITNVNNSINTLSLIEKQQILTDSSLAKIRRDIGVHSDNVCIYTGGLHPLKRIDFLLEAANAIRNKLPDFELIVIGDGVDSHKVKSAAANKPWIHYIGPKHNDEKVPYWSISKLLLMPGGVGLVAIDSFALGLPLVTTRNKLHGPEISYINNNVNGVIVNTDNDVELYATEVVNLLQNSTHLKTLALAAQAEREKYSIENMSCRFTTGIMDALATPRYRLL